MNYRDYTKLELCQIIEKKNIELNICYRIISTQKFKLFELSRGRLAASTPVACASPPQEITS